MALEHIGDEESVLRHIPGGTTWQAVGPRITSKNFELRPGETGVSVSRIALTTPEQLLARIGNTTTGSRIAIASVEAIRALGLDVVPDPKDYDHGHAEIRPLTADLGGHSLRRQLAALFGFVDLTPPKAIS